MNDGVLALIDWALPGTIPALICAFALSLADLLGALFDDFRFFALASA